MNGLHQPKSSSTMKKLDESIAQMQFARIVLEFLQKLKLQKMMMIRLIVVECVQKQL